MDKNDISQFQERLVSLYLRLNGYLQTGYIPHAKKWGEAGTDIDRIGLRFPGHRQTEREIECDSLIDIPTDSIDIVIAEVKNNDLKFNDSIIDKKKRAIENWTQILNWIGLFREKDIDSLVLSLIDLTSKNGQIENCSFDKITYESDFGLITIRPMLFVFEQQKSENDEKAWVNGEEILKYVWKCFCPEIKRDNCSTRYPFKLWGTEFSDIVEYIKDRHKRKLEIGTLSDMYSELIK